MEKTAQVNGQMELNFTEQKFPKKRSIAKKSVSKPKKEIKKQIAFSSEHYEKAIEIVKEREIIHLGTLMRCLHISAMESDAIIQKGLLDFLHIPGKVFNASQEYIDNAIEMFKKDLIESYHVTLL